MGLSNDLPPALFEVDYKKRVLKKRTYSFLKGHKYLWDCGCPWPQCASVCNVLLSRIPECRASRVYEWVWYRAVVPLWRQLSYVRSSRVLTPAYCTVCTSSPRLEWAPAGSRSNIDRF
ncbi:hypothetical protein EVAR_82445_1 [Eumeta japonica]|uniref:Uncharacterized protein n=1 Tax=Eumeta variegata TaxID=151549 RepID=A0A4C1YFU9_EUMVA|nr:hypothetical protein EVAR_82445_1 [Eumeta japonica]